MLLQSNGYLPVCYIYLILETPECSKFNYKDTKCSDVFIVNFERISHMVLVLALSTLNKEMQAGKSLLKKEPTNLT